MKLEYVTIEIYRLSKGSNDSGLRILRAPAEIVLINTAYSVPRNGLNIKRSLHVTLES